MNDILNKVIQTRTIEMPSGEYVSVNRTSISNKKGHLLQEALRKIKAVHTLEVGLAFGVSALFICDAIQQNPDAIHYVIDPYQFRQDTPWKGAGIHNLNKAGFASKVNLLENYSHIALTDLEKDGVYIDFAFIDGYHTFDHTLIDFFLVDKILNVGGMIAFDDTNTKSIRKVCAFIIQNRSYEIVSYIPSFHEKSKISFKHQFLRFILRSLEYFTPEGSYFLPKISQYGNLVDKTTQGGLVIFQKKKQDDRLWTHFEEF